MRGLLYYHVPLGNVGLGRRPNAHTAIFPYNALFNVLVPVGLPKQDFGLWEQRPYLNHLCTSWVNPSVWYRADAQCLFAKKLNFQKQHFTSSFNLHAFLLHERVFYGPIRWQTVTGETNTKETSQALLLAENRCHYELNCRNYLTSLLSHLENGDNTITCLKGLWGWNGKTHGGA